MQTAQEHLEKAYFCSTAMVDIILSRVSEKDYSGAAERCGVLEAFLRLMRTEELSLSQVADEADAK